MPTRTDHSLPMEERNADLKITKVSSVKGTDYEKAISATGYGIYNYLLYLVVIPVSWASTFDTANMSMILSSAECDLNLSLFHKGILNAITYAGMVSSAFLWGFIADVVGRRQILVYGFLADGICNAVTGLSQNFTTLVIFKFISGFIISGPYATIMTYCAEFHSIKQRPRVLLFVGCVCSAGCIVTAGMAWAIVPKDWSLVVGDNYFIFNSWRIYLSSCSIPIIIGAICISFFPESPKFLMSRGRNKEAMQVLKTMFAMNTGKPREEYPIHSLENELNFAKSEGSISTTSKSFTLCIYDGLQQMKPLLYGSYRSRLLLVVFIQFCGMMANNTIRLWQPQLFTILKQFESLPYDASRRNFTFCKILDYTTAMNNNESSAIKNVSTIVTCITRRVDDTVYRDTMIVSTAMVVGIFLACILVRRFGNKNLLLVCFIISIGSSLGMNWSSTSTMTLGITCLFLGLMSVTVNLAIGVTVNLFPTSTRTMAVSLIMMIGRIGSLLGNLMFPVVLEYGCFTTLLVLAGFLILSVLATIFIPTPKEEIK